MADRRGLSSRSAQRESGVDVKEWLGGVRFSGFMAIMMGLVVMAVFVLVPSIGTYLEQRQRISSLQQAVSVSKSQVEALEVERDRWKDPNYIASQARERLYYVRPGEVVFLVDNDLKESVAPEEQKQASEAVKKTDVNWMSTMLRSVTEAGMAKTAVPEGGTSKPSGEKPDSTVP